MYSVEQPEDSKEIRGGLYCYGVYEKKCQSESRHGCNGIGTLRQQRNRQRL
jgi:hypothetical protein